MLWWELAAYCAGKSMDRERTRQVRLHQPSPTPRKLFLPHKLHTQLYWIKVLFYLKTKTIKKLCGYSIFFYYTFLENSQRPIHIKWLEIPVGKFQVQVDPSRVASGKRDQKDVPKLNTSVPPRNMCRSTHHQDLGLSAWNAPPFLTPLQSLWCGLSTWWSAKVPSSVLDALSTGTQDPCPAVFFISNIKGRLCSSELRRQESTLGFSHSGPFVCPPTTHQRELRSLKKQLCASGRKQKNWKISISSWSLALKLSGRLPQLSLLWSPSGDTSTLGSSLLVRRSGVE